MKNDRKNLIIAVFFIFGFFSFLGFALLTFTRNLPLNQVSKPTQNTKKKISGPPNGRSTPVALPTPTNAFSILRVQDVGPIDDFKQKKIGVDNSLKEKVTHKSNIGVRVAPTDEFVDNYKKNDNDLKKTLEEVDINHPPVKGEIKINF